MCVRVCVRVCVTTIVQTLIKQRIENGQIFIEYVDLVAVMMIVFSSIKRSQL